MENEIKTDAIEYVYDNTGYDNNHIYYRCPTYEFKYEYTFIPEYDIFEE